MNDETYKTAMSAFFNAAVFVTVACLVLHSVGRLAVHCWFQIRRSIAAGQESLDAIADREANRPEYPE